jgi:hypothetical protein
MFDLSAVHWPVLASLVTVYGSSGSQYTLLLTITLQGSG